MRRFHDKHAMYTRLKLTYISQGEDICAAAIREVKEETSVSFELPIFCFP